MYTHTEKWPNGDMFWYVKQFLCNECHSKLCDSHPKYADHDKNFHLCVDCGFKKGFLTEKEYLRSTPAGSICDRAGVHDDQIYVWSGNRVPWEAPASSFRKTKQYREWRLKVFERDNHTCRHCSSEQNLQAHHIKPFATYTKLRYKVTNGLTLCETCHRKEHKRLKSGDKNVRCVSN